MSRSVHLTVRLKGAGLWSDPWFGVWKIRQSNVTDLLLLDLLLWVLAGWLGFGVMELNLRV